MVMLCAVMIMRMIITITRNVIARYIAIFMINKNKNDNDDNNNDYNNNINNNNMDCKNRIK